MIRPNLLYPLLLLAGTLVLASCSPSLIISVHDDYSSDIAFSSNPSPAGSALMRRFAGAGDASGPLYDRTAVSGGISAMGIDIETLSFPSGDGLSLTGRTASTGRIPGGALFPSPSTPGITLSLSPESVSAIMGNLPPETRDLLELLMAPVLTGEALEREEYRDILAAAYGERAAEEMTSSTCTVQVRAPRPVHSVRLTGPDSDTIPLETDGSTVTAAIPLDLLLTLREPLNLTVSW